MNYEKIYNDLIQKRRINKIDRTQENKNVEYHHIIPVSCNGINDKRDAAHNNENYNIVGLTLDEHFFAHLLRHDEKDAKSLAQHRVHIRYAFQAAADAGSFQTTISVCR